MLGEHLSSSGVIQICAGPIRSIDRVHGLLRDSAESRESALHLPLLSDQQLLRAPTRDSHGVLLRGGEEAVTTVTMSPLQDPRPGVRIASGQGVVKHDA